MVLIMVITTHPQNKAIKVAKAFLKAVEKEPPPYLKSRGVYGTYADEGYKYYNIVEIEDKHVSEGMTELMRRLVPFDDIEGLKTKMEILGSVRDGIELQMELGRI